MIWTFLLKIVGLVTLLFITCEFWIYYLVIWMSCSYPELPYANNISKFNTPALKVAFIADTHLLGSRNGHWFDKLRREWQMHRGFQTLMTLFNPEVVFFLGDVFDEGKWCGPEEFDYYANRFRSLFSTDAKVFVVAGNHDVGFHYATNPYLIRRFESLFEGSESVTKLNLKGNVFVLVNSMAMDRTDRCFLCSDGERRLYQIAKSLVNGTKPILLQHFPLYRFSDSDCFQEPEDETPFRENYDCLSRNSTDLLLKLIRPRLVLTGHTHNNCQNELYGILEVTVPSFSWRNRNDPSFVLAQIRPDEYALEKCNLPKETVVVNLYCLGVTLIIIYVLYSRRRRFYRVKRHCH